MLIGKSDIPMATKEEATASLLEATILKYRNIKTCTLVKNNTQYDVEVLCPYCGTSNRYYVIPPEPGTVDDEPCSNCGERFRMCHYE